YQDTQATVDPYSDAYNAPPAPASSERDPPAPRGRSRSRSPVRSAANGHANGDSDRDRYRSPPRRRRSPPARRQHLQPNPSNVLGVFGLSIRTQERDLEEEFSRYGHVEKVTIVYDQRSDRSRGFGFIRMGSVDEAAKCIEVLNGIELNGRRIRVDYSITDRPHASTPGEYMGHRRTRDRGDRGDRDRDRDFRDRDRDRDYYRRDRDRDRDYDRDKDRDYYGRDKDWRDRRSPPPKRDHSPGYRRGGYSPDHRRRRSYSRSPPPRGSSPPRGSTNGRDYEAPTAATPAAASDNNRW
ncbi:hypothetical protein CVT26_013106, partial [Gymnopilus dilepis]